MRNKLFREIVDQTPKDVEIFVKWYAEILLRIDELMEEKGFNQRALAQRLGKQPSEIHKWLNGDHNFTLRSLAKLQAELDGEILEIPKRKPAGTYQKVLNGNSFTVYSDVSKPQKLHENWTSVKIFKSEVANVG